MDGVWDGQGVQESSAKSTAEILDRPPRTERLGNLGWAGWDLTADTVHWSDPLFEIYERDRAADGDTCVLALRAVVDG